MSKITETLKTIGQGALVSVTFGIYNQIVTNQNIKVNNERMEIQQKYIINQIEIKNKVEIIELRQRINQLEKSFHKFLVHIFE